MTCPVFSPRRYSPLPSSRRQTKQTESDTGFVSQDLRQGVSLA